jgi:2-keto-4-pentenoate hydratase
MSKSGKAPLEESALEQIAHGFLVARRTAASAGPAGEYAALRDAETGLRVAAKLRQILAAEGVGISGLKLGALDPAAQRAMGLTGPIVAPLYEEWMLSEGAAISLGQFIEPKVEAEIGFRLVKGTWVAVGCLEIADSRLTGWSGRGGQILADFALNGAIVCGTDLTPVAETSYELRHDGEIVAHGRAPVADAARRMEGDAERSGARFVASGALHPLADLKPGAWSLRFRGGGEATITVSAVARQ